MVEVEETSLVVQVQYVSLSLSLSLSPLWSSLSPFIRLLWKTNQTDYVLSAALDSGVAVATVIIFFCITLPAGSLSWWGNTVYQQTADGKGTPWKGLPDRGFFGPDAWE